MNNIRQQWKELDKEIRKKVLKHITAERDFQEQIGSVQIAKAYSIAFLLLTEDQSTEHKQ